jgi:hypothetical protein
MAVEVLSPGSRVATVVKIAIAPRADGFIASLIVLIS